MQVGVIFGTTIGDSNMTTTTPYESSYDIWLAVSEGNPSVTIQLQSNGPLLFQIAQSLPSAGDQSGTVLDIDGDTSFSGNALAVTDIVYVKSKNVGETERVSVIKT